MMQEMYARWEGIDIKSSASTDMMPLTLLWSYSAP